MPEDLNQCIPTEREDVMPKSSAASRNRTLPETPASPVTRQSRLSPVLPREIDPEELDALPWEELWTLAVETLHTDRQKTQRENGPTV
jgi:hypothetical protein